MDGDEEGSEQGLFYGVKQGVDGNNTVQSSDENTNGLNWKDCITEKLTTMLPTQKLKKRT